MRHSARTTNRLLLPLLTLSVCSVSSLAFGDGGDVRWLFEFASPFGTDDLTVGSDGTVYASDNFRLYAIDPGGGVVWSRDGVGGGNGTSALPNGNLVTGLGDDIFVLDPQDGSTVWTRTYDSNGLIEQIEVGPTVGPDGHIYGVTSIEDGFGLGAFSFTAQGDLRWTDQGSPTLNRITIGTGKPVLFTDDRLVFPFEFVAAGTNAIYAYDFDGDQTQYVDFTCTSFPRVDPLGRIIIGGGCGYQAVSTDSSQVFWTVDLGSSHVGAAVGQDATVYGASTFGNLTAINPDGSIKWQSSEATDATGVIGVRDDIGLVVYVKGEFGSPNTICGVDIDDGSVRWTRPLRIVQGHNELSWNAHAPFSPDGSTIYLTTRFTSNGANAALYAIDTGAGTQSCAADFNTDGNLDFFDISDYLGAFNAGDLAADFNDDGNLDFFDVSDFLGAFTSGCP